VPVPLSAIFSGELGRFVEIDTLPFEVVAVVGANVMLTEAVCPGFKLCAARLDMLNPVPVMLLAVIESAAVPVFVSVTGTVALLFTAKFPKGMLAGFAVRVPCVPVPLTGIESVPFVALDVIEIVPVAAPGTVGSKAAEN